MQQEDNGGAGDILAYKTTTTKVELPTLTPSGTRDLAAHFQVDLVDVGGFQIPATEKAQKAGIKAMANQLTLMLQSGQISQDQFDRATAALAVPAQNQKATAVESDPSLIPYLGTAPKAPMIKTDIQPDYLNTPFQVQAEEPGTFVPENKQLRALANQPNDYAALPPPPQYLDPVMPVAEINVRTALPAATTPTTETKGQANTPPPPIWETITPAAPPASAAPFAPIIPNQTITQTVLPTAPAESFSKGGSKIQTLEL